MSMLHAPISSGQSAGGYESSTQDAWRSASAPPPWGAAGWQWRAKLSPAGKEAVAAAHFPGGAIAGAPPSAMHLQEEGDGRWATADGRRPRLD